MNINFQFMQALGRLLDDEKGQKQKALLHVIPAIRLGTAFLCILLCALSHNAVYTYTVIAVQMTRLAAMNRQALRRVVRKTVTAAAFTMIVMLPAVWMGQYAAMLTVTMKVTESVLVLSILNEIISWSEMTEAFRFYHMPSVFVLILDMTIRFLVILGRYSNAIVEAVKLRSVGKTGWKDSHLGGILGTTFLKAQKMARETTEAMTCRCFNGTYLTIHKQSFSWQDAVYLLVPAFLILFFILTERAV